MDKNNKSNILLFVFMILGFILALQFRSIMSQETEEPSVALAIEALTDELNYEKLRGSKLREEIDQNIKTRDLILREIMEERNSGEITQEWDKARILAGLTEVVGDGVIITLNDALEDGDVVHDFYLYEIINEIKKAEPVAMSINNERIISTTEIICAGPAVRINRNRYPVPYEIRIIGDSKNIREYFFNSYLVSVVFNYENIRYQVRDAKDIVIPKYSGNIDVLTTGVEVLN
ncbi:UNVERIFIED_CONTAM: uncharacterized protein YlxW (UPF0749 family) [Acetivibrio alkalicellulosi]